ncbi:4'-phosphopantetheinyl transferase superfamily, partial [Yarrowia lipolytica]|uniref:YALI0B16082p n=2 Tax=Yarrowia lipolytica TaxID=4952 RepID=Q6CEF4_YARLI|eukprot:XP_500958.1 YALI0B16082p [Yarrowia lipolytica CLIB122]
MTSIGVDILRTARIGHILAGKTRERFVRKILHPSEITRMTKYPDHVQFVASTFSTKEALFKTLDRQDQKLFEFKEWCRGVDEVTGRRLISNPGYRLMDHEEFVVSVSHDGDYTIANVLRKKKE